MQHELLEQVAGDSRFTPEQTSESTILDHFRLLQAMDNLSLLTCVDFQRPANLLHELPTVKGDRKAVNVRSAGARHFILDPYPFAEPVLTFRFPARHVKGKLFSSGKELQDAFNAAAVETLSVTVARN